MSIDDVLYVVLFILLNVTLIKAIILLAREEDL
jgi:hypothetical protein